MTEYLVVAHETASSPALRDTLRDIRDTDADASFTLVVPAKKVEHLLTWTEGEATAVAQATAMAARDEWERDGLRVTEAVSGDESPLQAIADALNGRRAYEAVVISTFPPGLSRWLKLDVHARARKRFHLPVISVVSERQPVASTHR